MVNVLAGLTLLLTFLQSTQYQSAIDQQGTWITRVVALAVAVINFLAYNAGRVAVKTK